MSDLEIVADRFMVTTSGAAIDLATGRRVTLSVRAAGDAAEQVRWAVSCDAARQLLRPSGSRLVDYGSIGAAQRFEAWSQKPPGAGRAGGLPRRTSRMRAPAGRGFAGISGIAVIRRPAIAAIAELFEPAGECRPRIVALFGPRGAGKTTVVIELARAARLSGMTPVCTGMLTQQTLSALRGHTLLVIDEDPTRSVWGALVALTVASPRPHVLLMASEEEIGGVHNIALDRLPAGVLAAAIRPAVLPASLTRRIQRAAERADGLPGRFVDSLCGPTLAGASGAIGRPNVTARGRRVAEQPAAYEVFEEASRIESLRRRLESATSQIAVGRYAPGERALRQTIGSLARREDWHHAGQGAIVLAQALLKRGRARDALAVLENGSEYGTRAGRGSTFIQAATLTGHGWIDLARLDEAESVLAAAQGAAAASGDRGCASEVALAMARCLFWRGRYAEADAALQSVPEDQMPDAMLVKVGIARARNAVGLRDYGRAVSAAADAHQRATASSASDLAAAAACASAFAHLSVSDLDAVRRDVTLALASARAARSPLHAIRARLLLAESERRRDRRTAAGTLLRRLTRVSDTQVPPIVRARAALLAELLKADAPAREVVTRHASVTGLPALVLLAPDAPGMGESGRMVATVDHFLEILTICQTASEEMTVLNEVCAHLRRELHAAGVAFIAADNPSAPPIASDGSRVDRAIAHRAVNASTLISPHRLEDRVEAAAPVCYGGATIGAIVARWPIGTSRDLSGAGASLAVAASAAAPAVAAALARRTAQSIEEPTQLLGVSALTAELRRTIGRAAAAPFSVLIEGESGSGKELVARAIHRGSPRRARPFCTLNCAALPDDLVESELFGHARGAFTGAVSERPGVFEEAHGGTVFLDEIGELSPRAQAKVLRVIQEGELRRVGENIGRRVDLRIVSATNRDLRTEVGAGRFRLDLLYRLDVVRIVVAPLRDRREDIAVLAGHIWAEAAARVGSQATLAAATVAALALYDWPGNVRELQNVLAALAVRTGKRGVVPPSALPPQFGSVQTAEAWRLDEARRTFEERFVRAALVRSGGRRAEAASELGVTRQGLTKLMTRLGIAP